MNLHDDATADGVPVLRVTGDIDLETAGELQRRLTAVLDAGPTLAVVDLSGVDFFDSTGLKVLDDVQRDARERGAALALVCPDERLLRLFRITGLLDRFHVGSTAELAAGAGT